jgi:hypothetical protein
MTRGEPVQLASAYSRGGKMQSQGLLRLIHGIRGTSAAISGIDLAVCSFLLLIGAFQFTHCPRTSDFLNDPQYVDIARSIVDHGSYEFNFLPMTTLPPGLSLLLAVAGWLAGFTPAVMFHVIAVCTTLAMIASYQLLRNVEGRGVAAVACLLLACSPSLLGYNTALIFPEMPYFLMSMVTLLLAVRMDRSDKASIGRMLLLSVTVVAAVLVRSIGIALVVGMGAWIVASLVLVPESGRRRLKRFLLPLTLGLIAQLGWSLWAQRHEVLEWPNLPGYPQSYVSQLKVKNGQYPELGMAHLSDIPSRVERNIVTRTIGFDKLLTRRYVSSFWSSPAIAGVILLILLGLVSSFRNGGQLHDWYFLWSEIIFLMWPWDYRERFIYPVVPLACLYIWRGAKMLKDCAVRQPEVTGLWAFFVGLFLSIVSACFALRILSFEIDKDHARGDHLQPIVATLFWLVSMAVGFVIFKFQTLRNSPRLARALGSLTDIAQPLSPLGFRVTTGLIVAALVASGIVQQVAVGNNNMNPDLTRQSFYPEIEAAAWIKKYEPNRVIMAREQDTLFHYTGQRVVWFPPISDPKVLMDGIRRHHVDVLIVAHHSDSYWLPLEDTCFQSLRDAYGKAFQLVHQGHDYKIFEVRPPGNGA